MEKSNPLVSIIIPAYNCAEYVGRAVNSVLNQSYLNKEIIVVNDGSTDETDEILRKYEKKITVIKQKNSGVSKARNMGISNAKGKYVAILDADDAWLPQRLEKMIPYLEKNKVDILISNSYYVNEQGERLSSTNSFPNNYSAPLENKQYNSLLWTATNFNLMIIKKSLIDEVGGYDVSLKGEAEDYDLWLRLLKNGAVWGYYPEPLAEITYRSGSLSRGYSKNRGASLKKIFNKQIDRIGKFKAWYLYRYHLGGYRWDMIIVSIKEKNLKKVFTYTLLMFKSPLFIPIIIWRISSFIYRKKIKPIY